MMEELNYITTWQFSADYFAFYSNRIFLPLYRVMLSFFAFVMSSTGTLLLTLLLFMCTQNNTRCSDRDNHTYPGRTDTPLFVAVSWRINILSTLFKIQMFMFCRRILTKYKSSLQWTIWRRLVNVSVHLRIYNTYLKYTILALTPPYVWRNLVWGKDFPPLCF